MISRLHHHVHHHGLPGRGRHVHVRLKIMMAP